MLLGALQRSSVQWLSHVWHFVTPWTAAHQASLDLTISWNLPKFMSIASVMPSSHLTLSSPSPSVFKPFQHQGLFQWVGSLHRWPKYWNFSFRISPSFRTDWLDLLAVQGTLKSLLQHHSAKASILRPSAFFIVQLSHSYMTTGKTIALSRQTFVGRVMSLLLNMLSMLVITCLPRSKCLLLSWLQSPSAVILERPPKNKVSHCFLCFPIYLPWNDGTGCRDLSFLNV